MSKPPAAPAASASLRVIRGAGNLSLHHEGRVRHSAVFLSVKVIPPAVPYGQGQAAICGESVTGIQHPDKRFIAGIALHLDHR